MPRIYFYSGTDRPLRQTEYMYSYKRQASVLINLRTNNKRRRPKKDTVFYIAGTVITALQLFDEQRPYRVKYRQYHYSNVREHRKPHVGKTDSHQGEAAKLYSY